MNGHVGNVSAFGVAGKSSHELSRQQRFFTTQLCFGLSTPLFNPNAVLWTGRSCGQESKHGELRRSIRCRRLPFTGFVALAVCLDLARFSTLATMRAKLIGMCFAFAPPRIVDAWRFDISRARRRTVEEWRQPSIRTKCGTHETTPCHAPNRWRLACEPTRASTYPSLCFSIYASSCAAACGVLRFSFSFVGDIRFTRRTA